MHPERPPEYYKIENVVKMGEAERGQFLNWVNSRLLRAYLRFSAFMISMYIEESRLKISIFKKICFMTSELTYT